MDREGEKPRRDLPERTFQFALKIVRLCLLLDRMSSTVRTLTRQLLRCGTSIGANVQEGQGSQSRADFIAKYYIACKEARETLYWLRLLAALGVVPDEQLKHLCDEANQIVAILTAIVKTARKNGVEAGVLHPRDVGGNAPKKITRPTSTEGEE